MSKDYDAAIDRARRDLSNRLDLSVNEIVLQSADSADFPDAVLGAPVEDEMSAQVITPGWRISLQANGKNYEYRASGGRLRLFNFNGQNYRL
jgi:hypothetical protein